jgi:inorganic triphosphatase YgiF
MYDAFNPSEAYGAHDPAQEIIVTEEVEITLRIASNDPEEVFRRIISLRTMGGFKLIPRGSITMHDTYFDTAGFDLGKLGYALRLRAQGGKVLLALKGRERIDSLGGISRLEIEGPWSGDILSQIACELGPDLVKVQPLTDADPLDAMEALGFTVIQSRETMRTLMNLYPERDEMRFGEMALDRVCYRAMGTGYLHYEIEIEAKGTGAQERLREFAGCLIEAFPNLLKPWVHNKLITGIALEELIRLHKLPQGRTDGMTIPLAWYDALDAWIRQKRG